MWLEETTNLVRIDGERTTKRPPRSKGEVTTGGWPTQEPQTERGGSYTYGLKPEISPRRIMSSPSIDLRSCLPHKALHHTNHSSLQRLTSPLGLESGELQLPTLPRRVAYNRRGRFS